MGNPITEYEYAIFSYSDFRRVKISSFRNVTSTTTNYMWGGCQRNVIDRYQDYNNEQNIYLLDNVENLSMWRYYDRFWSHKV